ncbi:MAG: hypothetical protein HQ517_00265 [SAR324 cluster bacterium]|nr:hypothetical protein [SAR324 cluster bacterium]
MKTCASKDKILIVGWGTYVDIHIVIKTVSFNNFISGWYGLEALLRQLNQDQYQNQYNMVQSNFF